MASTNSYDFTVTRDQLITDAHLYIGAIGEGESPTTAQVTEAARLLNMIVKHRATDGMPLWALKRGYMLPNTSISSMNTNSHVVTTYDSTTISAAEAAAQTTISITSGTGMADADQIGIELDDGSMHWTTISSGGGTTTPVIVSALPSAAAAGNRVYAYTASSDRVQRPLRIVEANVMNVVSNVSWGIDIVTRDEYFKLGGRTAEGVINQIYYEPTLGAVTADPSSSTNWYGTIFFYPRFVDGKCVVEFTYHRAYQDFDAAGDTPDFPQEFYLALMLELAALLAPKFGIEDAERKVLHAEAKMYREEALSSQYAEGSLRLVPDSRYD